TILHDGHAGGDEGTAWRGSFDNDGTVGKAADDAVADGEVRGEGRGAGAELGEDETSLGDGAEKAAVGLRIDDVDPGAEHGDGRRAGVEGGPVGYGVDAEGQAGDDGRACGGETPGQMQRGV